MLRKVTILFEVVHVYVIDELKSVTGSMQHSSSFSGHIYICIHVSKVSPLKTPDAIVNQRIVV